MSNKWITVALAASIATTMVNAAVFIGQLSAPAAAKNAASSAGKLLDDEDFLSGVRKIVRKTVRDYCTVGKKDAIDC